MRVLSSPIRKYSQTFVCHSHRLTISCLSSRRYTIQRIDSVAMTQEYILFGLGNPLLDIQAVTGTDILEKYNIKANDAILAEEKHMPLYEELVQKYKVHYVAGGAAQNSIRGAQYLLPPNSTVYVGCVGKDDFAAQLREATKKEGVRTEYMTVDTSTGKCGVVITGHDRSLVTDLGAANEYKLQHLKSPEIWKLVENAKYFYVGGYHLTVCPPAIVELGKHAAETNKVFSMNLSAPFLCQFFKEPMDQTSPYWDYLFGNESEAAAWGEAHGLETKSVQEIAKHIALLPKVNSSRPRVVVITQGADPTIVAIASEGKIEITEYPTAQIPSDEIVDSNGAGDAFAGAFLAQLILGSDIPTCVKAGQWLAGLCLRSIGPAYPFPKKQFQP